MTELLTIAASTDGGGLALGITEGGSWFLRNVWLIPLLPALSFVGILFFGKRMPRGGSELGVAALGIAFLLAVVTGAAWVDHRDDYHGEEVHRAVVVHNADADAHADDHGVGHGHPSLAVHRTATWFQTNGVEFTVGTLADGPAVMMLLVVTLVSLLVHVYSTDYVHGDRRYTHFFAFLSLFSASMLLLVVSENTLQLLCAWELVGVCSFVLIGHWWEEKPNSDAALKAFLTNRVGDMGLLVGVTVLFFAVGSALPDRFGSFSIAETNALASSGALPHTTLLIASCCLMAAVMSKSGQFFLHTWLPDAMAGPTPVSALIHAATMVVAGVFMIARMYGVFFEGFQIGGSSINLMAFIGGLTTIVGACLAFVQRDIKKVLAYSTISQLGYMFLAVGCGAYVAAVFHMVTHAFFKALLFLGSGSVIHGMNGDQDMAHYGGLRRFMPVTAGTFVVGWLAIAGVPPFAGFWSKDEILAFAWNESPLLWAVGLVTAVLTAFYMTRQVVLTFFGRGRFADPRPAEVEAAWEARLAEADATVEAAEQTVAAETDNGQPAEGLEAAEQALATARAEQATLRAAAEVRPESTGLALETAPDVGPVADALPDEVAVRAEHHPHESPRSMTFPLVVLAALSMVGGLVQLPFSSTTKRLEHWLEPTLFHNEAHLSIGAGTLWILAVVAVLGGLVGIGVAVAAYAARRVDHRLFEQPVLANAWRLDRAVSRFMGGPGRAGFEAVARFDEVVVDGAVDGVATLVRKEAGLLRRFHNGLVRTYAVGIGVGAVGLVAWFLSRSSF